ncbi:hypothetical protein MTO96_037200 [Rhipicephalus appendiculatus]
MERTRRWPRPTPGLLQPNNAQRLSEHAQGKNAPSVASKRVKQFHWRPRNTPRIEKDDIIVVLKPRETVDLKATFGPGEAGTAVRSIIGADASVELAVKDFPPLTPVQPQVSSLGGAVSGPSPFSSPTEAALQQQVEELRRQNQILARKIQELEAKLAESERVQGADVEERDDGSSVTSCLIGVSRQGADTVVGSVSAAGDTGRLESLERKPEQLEERVAALPNQIMSAVRESFQDMFMAALTQALPEIVTQVTDSVLKAVQPWISTQITNTTQCDPPQLKRKTASRQAVEEKFSGTATGGPAWLLPGAAPAPGPSHSPRTVK